MRARSSVRSVSTRSRLLATLMVALLLPFMAATSTAQAAPSCPDVFFIGVRGSGDSPTARRGMGPAVEPVYDALVAAMPDSTIDGIGLDYPAPDAFRSTAGSLGGRAYRNSVSDGARQLRSDVSSRASSCPVTPVVLAGHSQGAHVIDRYLAQATEPETVSIVGVALLGDPTRFPTRPYNISPNPPAAGVWHAPGMGAFRADTEPPASYWGILDSFCIPGDHICAGGPDDGVNFAGDARFAALWASTTHSSYDESGVSDQAGTILAIRAQRVLDDLSPEAGTHGPAIFNNSLLAMGIAPTDSGNGYWLVLNDGGVDNYGDAPVAGSLGGNPLNAPVVGMAAMRTPTGYWLVGADGGVFAFGEAPFYGSLGDTPPDPPIVGIAPSAGDGGYWLADSDGSVYAFGSAPLLGSADALDLAAPVVGIAATPDGGGYWLAAADGGVFAFGTASFTGSMAGQPLNAPVVGIASTVSGAGYRLVAADGGVFAFGDATFLGSGVDRGIVSSVTGIASNPTAPGYWITTSDGSVYGFGDAPLYDD